jgi:hypothetical protein
MFIGVKFGYGDYDRAVQVAVSIRVVFVFSGLLFDIRYINIYVCADRKLKPPFNRYGSICISQILSAFYGYMRSFRDNDVFRE